MTTLLRKRWIALVMVYACTTLMVGRVYAADPPKWVAALYVEAQKTVGLRWMPAPGATGFKVLRSETAGSGYTEIATTSTPQHFDKDVQPGSTYYYVLQSVAGAEVSANSLEKSVTIPGKKVQTTAPPVWDRIADQQATEFGKTIHKVGLTWNRIPDVVAYNIYRSETSGEGYSLVGSVTDARYIDTAVEEEKTYFYVLTALDGSLQETKYSEEKSIAIVKEVAPASTTAKAVKNKIVVKKTKTAMILPLEDDLPLQSLADMVAHREEEKIYAVDNLAGKIVVFDEEGKRLADFGSKGLGTGRFQTPASIAVDGEGNLVVADIGRKTIMFFEPGGTFIREFRVDAALDEEDGKPVPVSAAVTSDGEVVITDNFNSRVLVYSDDGELLRGWGERAEQGKTKLGFFSAPGQIIVDSEDRIMLRDYGVGRVQIFDLEGEPLFSIGEGVKGLVGSFVKVGKPVPVLLGETKEIIVPDNAMGNIQAFGWEDGKYLYTLTGPEGKLLFNERADWELGSTNMVDVDSQGRIWVSMNLDKKLVVLDLLP